MTTPSSYIFLSDPSQDTVKVFDSNGNFLQDLTTPYQVNPAGVGPDGLAIGADKNLYVGTILDHSVLEYNSTNGQYLGKFVTSGEDGLGSVTNIAFGPNGDLYVSNFDAFAGQGPNGIIVDPTKTDNILVFSPTGQYLQTLNFPTTGPKVPIGLAFITDPTTNHPELLVSTRGGTYENNVGGTTTIVGGNTIYSFDITQSNPTASVFATGGSLDSPAGLLAANNFLYASSLDNNKILKYNLDGTLNSTFVADTTTAGINGPTALALSPDGQELSVTAFNSQNASIINSNTGALVNNFIPTGGTPILGFLKNSGELWVTPAQIGGVVVPEPLNILGAVAVAMFGAFVKKKLKK